MTLRPAAATTPNDGNADAFCASGSSPTRDERLPEALRGTAELRSAHLTDPDGNPLRIAYELVGNPAGTLVVVLGGISANRHVVANNADETAGWWQKIVGRGQTIDTDSCRVLAFDYLGGPTAPVAPSLSVSSQDQAHALACVLDHLNIVRVDDFIGSSYGGMVALAFAERTPERVAHLILVGAAHRSHPMATAWRALQRNIVQLGIAGDDAARGLQLARGLAMTTYRSAVEFDDRFATSNGSGATSPVESYLESRGRTFADAFPPGAFATLSESIDRHGVDPANIAVPTDLIAVDTDTLTPPWLVEELRDGLAGPTRLRQIESKVGHDAFLADTEPIGRAIADFLATPRDIPTPSRVTRTVRAAVGADQEHGAVMPPLYLSSNYTFAGLGVKRQHDYSRTSNPTRDHLADAIAELERAVGAVVTSSGMSAVALVLQLLEPDDLVVMTHDCYGGTHRLATRLAARGAFRLEYADLTDEAGIEAAAAEKPKMIWVETPSNPLLRITDLAAVARAAHACGALLAVDNTFLSPALQRPIDHGVDIVVHSTTKFINGHSDVIGGAVAAATPEVLEELAWWANALGLSGSPFDSYLTLRGLRTLDARVRIHQENAKAIAETLAAHPSVENVYYPGLSDHPGYTTACRQQEGPGSLLSFELAGGQAAVAAFVDGLQHFALAESLGGVESLIAQPTTMTHAAMDPVARAKAGIRDSLLRLSVGIEDPQDLVADIQRGLDRAGRVR